MVVEAAPSKSTLSVPLARNSNFNPNAKAVIAKTKVKTKYVKHVINPLHNVSANVTTEGTGSAPVTNYSGDPEYYGVVGIGTPEQKVRLDFDSGSSDFLGCSYKADGRHWATSYGDGSTASGILDTDAVNLGGLKIKGQTIELARVESNSFANGPNDGLLGLGFDLITTADDIQTPVNNLISQGLISSPVFGVFLGKASRSGGGEYIFGGYDSSKFTGSLKYAPIDNSDGHWSIAVDGLSAGGSRVAHSFSDILDTGAILLILTDSFADAIADAVAYGAIDDGDGTYLIDCDNSNFGPIVFNIDGTTFQVPAEDLVYEDDGNVCFASFAKGGLRFALLGDTFLKNNYVVFNQEVPEVQIAPTSY
ncbi:rhizopuspepsin 2 precursor [Blakeslea trispora]|nr:rhizopuspepsin 2 precursor [Blakeslea trispora]